MIRLAAALLPALALTACGDAPSPGSEPIAEDAQITVDGGWVRIPPGGRDVTAGYLVVNANYNTRLVGATTGEAAHIELHTMTMEGDVMRMREVDGYDIRAGEPFRLASGGDHLMIFGLQAGALDDGEMALTLEFEDGATVEATLPASVTQPG